MKHHQHGRPQIAAWMTQGAGRESIEGWDIEQYKSRRAQRRRVSAPRQAGSWTGLALDGMAK